MVPVACGAPELSVGQADAGSGSVGAQGLGLRGQGWDILAQAKVGGGRDEPHREVREGVSPGSSSWGRSSPDLSKGRMNRSVWE